MNEAGTKHSTPKALDCICTTANLQDVDWLPCLAGMHPRGFWKVQRTRADRRPHHGDGAPSSTLKASHTPSSACGNGGGRGGLERGGLTCSFISVATVLDIMTQQSSTTRMKYSAYMKRVLRDCRILGQQSQHSEQPAEPQQQASWGGGTQHSLLEPRAADPRTPDRHRPGVRAWCFRAAPPRPQHGRPAARQRRLRHARSAPVFRRRQVRGSGEVPVHQEHRDQDVEIKQISRPAKE